MNVRKQNDEIYYSTQAYPTVGQADIEFLKQRALENERKRARICLHESVESPLQDMIIVFHGTTYFRPLRHVERPQFFHVLEGAMSLVLLQDDGAIAQVIELAAQASETPFESFVPPGTWYSFVMHTQWLVIRETTTGPMTATDREYAHFAPEEGAATARAYALDLQQRAKQRR